MSINFKETDMFPSIKFFLETKGYVVNAEVKGIDVVATGKEDINDVIALELKTSFNLKLLYQVIDRQRLIETVYMVIPRPVKTTDKTFTKIKHIARKLEVGLITIAMDSPLRTVEICVDANKSNRLLKNRASRVQKEISGRELDSNVGGSVRKKLLTAFRERSIKIACTLYKIGATSPAKLVKEYDCPKDTRNILSSNHYEWFIKVERGIYDISEVGRNEIENGVDFRTAFEYYKN